MNRRGSTLLLAWPSRRLVASRLQIWLPLIVAVVIAFLLSTEFFFQPFIWRNFAMSEILAAWFTILGDRLIAALPIAAALAICWRLPIDRRRSAAIVQITAVLIGAIAGEWLLDGISADAAQRPMLQIVGEVTRWTSIGVAVTVLLYIWRSAIAADIAVEDARADAARIRRLAASGRIEVLQRQIEPHFLFNTLATIRSLHAANPERGQGMLTHLLTLVSHAIGQREDSHPTLRSEVALVRAYLGLCEARLGGSLVVRYNIPDNLLDRFVPPLALSTLAENAIKHGIAPQDGGVVTISAIARDGGLAIDLCDNGVGFDGTSSGSGIGLANVGERLRLMYGAAARLELVPLQDGGVRAGFWIPDQGALG